MTTEKIREVKEQFFKAIYTEPGSKFPRKLSPRFCAELLRSNITEDKEGRSLTLTVGSEFAGDYLKKIIGGKDEIYVPLLSNAVKAVGYSLGDFKIAVDKGVEENPFALESKVKSKEIYSDRLPEIKEQELPELSELLEPQQTSQTRIQKTYLNPSRVFDNFQVSENNREAYDIVQFLLGNTSHKLPAKILKLAFINAGVGLGKTHLLQAIASEIKEKADGREALYFTSTDFKNFITGPFMEKDPNAYSEARKLIRKITSLPPREFFYCR